MPISRLGGSRTGGSGVLIVATRSDNDNPAAFADFAALEAYTATTDGTADAERIRVANADNATECFVVGTLNAGNQVTGISAAYIRIQGNPDSWLAVATNLVGTPGMDVDLSGVANGAILFNENGSVAGSAFTESPTLITSTKDIQLPPGSVTIGNLTVSDAGIGLNISDGAYGVNTLSVSVPYSDSGSSAPRYANLAAQTDAVVQSDDSQVLASNAITVVAPDAPGRDGAVVSTYRFRFANALTNTRFTVALSSAPSTLIFRSHSDADYAADQGVTTSATGDTVFNIQQSTNTFFNFNDGESYIFTFESTNGTPQLRGNASNVFYYSRIFQPYELVELMTGATDIYVTGASWSGRQLSLTRSASQSTLMAAMPNAVATPEGGGSGSDGAMSESDKTKLDTAPADIQAALDGKENSLGNPSDPVSAIPRFLQSTNAGTRSWERTMRFRGQHSTSNFYAAGEVVHHLYAGEQRVWIAEADQSPNSGSPGPGGGAAIGAWRRLDFLAWQGAWADGHFEPGNIVTQSGATWMANTVIALGSSAPSDTNTAWTRIDRNESGGGGGGEPTRLFVRQNTTLPASTVDNTIVVVDGTGTNNITVTMPDITAVASTQNKRITVINNRSDVNAMVTIAFATGDSIRNAFNDTYVLRAAEAAEFYASDENLWTVNSESNVLLVPNFPGNSQNDTNTFFFSVNGDSSTTWMRDMDTAINMRSDNGTVSYELANPATSGVSVADGEGYIFRHTSGSNNVQVFPFSAANQFFIGATEYTVSSPYVLPLNSSVVVIYNTSNSRWEGRVFNFLVGGSSGGSGASGSSQTTQNVFGDVGGTGFVETTTNRSGARKNGDLVIVKGSEGGSSCLIPIINEPISGHVVGDTADDATIMVKEFGIAQDIQVNNSSGDGLTTPLANDTELFVARSFGQADYITNDSQSGAHILWGQVTGSRYTVTETGSDRSLGTNVSFASAAQFDADRNKRIAFVGTGTNDYVLPSFTTASVNNGDEVVITVPATHIVNFYGDNAGGTLNLRDEDNNEYTSGSKLALSNGTRKFKAVVQEGVGSYWLVLGLGADVVLHDLYFDAKRYNDAVGIDAVQMVMNIASNNQSRIDNLESKLIVPTGANYTASNDDVIYSVSPTSNTSHTFTIGQTSLWSIAANRAKSFDVINTSDQFWFKLDAHASWGNFDGTSTPEIWIAPSQRIHFDLTFNGSSYGSVIDGPIKYDWAFEAGVFNGGNPNFIAEGNVLPTELVEVPSGNTDRIEFKHASNLQSVRLDGQYLFNGTAAADFASLASLTPSISITKNGSTQEATHDTTVMNISGAKAAFHNEINPFDVVANDYIGFSATDFTDITAVTLSLRGSIVIKPY